MPVPLREREPDRVPGCSDELRSTSHHSATRSHPGSPRGFRDRSTRARSSDRTDRAGARAGAGARTYRMHGEVIRVIVEGSMDTLREYPAAPAVPTQAPTAPASGPTPSDTLVSGQPTIDVNLLTEEVRQNSAF